MGLLYTTEGTRRILDTLNTAFDGPNAGLMMIRDAVKTDSKLQRMVDAKKWNPGKLATALQLLPFDQSPKADPIQKKDIQRWAYFLKKVLGKPQFEDLTRALADAILNQVFLKDIVRVTFEHVELKQLSNANLVIFDGPLPGFAGKWVRHVTLFTERVEEGKEDKFDPPTGDDPTPLPKEKAPWKTSELPP